jgi:hypothetical protein
MPQRSRDHSSDFRVPEEAPAVPCVFVRGEAAVQFPPLILKVTVVIVIVLVINVPFFDPPEFPFPNVDQRMRNGIVQPGTSPPAPERKNHNAADTRANASPSVVANP